MSDELYQESTSVPGDGQSLSLDNVVRAHLTNAAKWGRFLAIVGFVAIGLMVVFGFFFAAIMNMMTSFGNYPDESMMMLPSVFYSVLYLIIAAIYFFPVWYLYRFSTNMLNAIPDESQEGLIRSFENLKSFFKFMGIFTIVMLCLYGLVFLFAVLGGLGAMMM